MPAEYSTLVSCFKKPTDKEKVDCFAQQVDNSTFTSLLRCVGNGRPTSDKLLECGATPAIQSAANDMRKCIASAPTPKAARDCLFKGVDPQSGKLTECLAKAHTGADATVCLDVVSPDYQKARSEVSCLNNSKNSALSCSEQVLTGTAKALVTCLGNAKDAAGQVACASSADAELPRAQKVAACVKESPQAAKLLGCVTPYLGGDAQKFATCIAGSPSNLTSCLSAVNPQMKAANDALGCVTAAKTNDKIFGCLASQVGGDGARIAGCINGGDKMSVAVCLFGNKPEVRAAQSAYQCVSKTTDVASAVENCTEALPLDDKTRQTLTCAARAGGDTSKLAACAAGAVLPPDAARMVSCAANSTGATSFALCAAGPAMNEEWRIVAECAVETGGNPIGAAGCAAGSLTIRELTKCFTGTIGKDCFGPDNTIIKDLTNAFNDVIHGPGPNNEIVKAVKAIGELTGGPNSVINNPRQIAGGSNSIINNPGQIWGGPHSVFNDPHQIWGGPNSVFNNPKQLLGGSNSVVNNPGQLTGGKNSVVNNPGQLTGGKNSVVNNPGQLTGGKNSVVNNPGQLTGGHNSVINCPLGGC